VETAVGTAMKFVVKRDDLLAAVSAVGNAVSARASMPVLGNALLEAGDGGLRIAATDLEIGMEARVPAEVSAPGSTTLPHRLLADIASNLPEGESVSFSVKDDVAEVRSGPSKFKVRGIPASEFPNMPDVSGIPMAIDSGLLKSMLRQTAVAASQDDARPFLTGVYLSSDGATLRAAATDGGRLAVRKEQKTGPALYAIVPGKAVTVLLKVLPAEGDVAVDVQNHQAVFSAPGLKVFSRLVAGTFPKYENIIPAEGVQSITVGTERLLRAVRRASITAKDSANVVRLVVERGAVTLESNTPDVGDASESLEARTSGEDVTLAFNSKFLMDALSSIDSAEVTLLLTGTLTPFAVRTADKPDSYVYVLAPVRVYA